MNKHISSIFCVISIGCGSTSTTTVECTSPECFGNDAGAGASSTGGGSSTTVTNGTGGNNSTGSSAGTGNSTSSTGGNSTISTCVAKTCDQIAAAAQVTGFSNASACGSASDGCGGSIDCGNCSTDPPSSSNTGCGQSSWSTSTQFPVVPIPTANICGTRCLSYGSNSCQTQLGQEWINSWNTSNPTKQIATNAVSYSCPSSPSLVHPIGLTGCVSIPSVNWWCCNPS